MEPIKNIPVLLLTGYLGSGKTTLLNRILKNQEGIKFAVIVNDIGEVNIDADLIEKGGVVGQKDDSLVALQNGCICCTLKMDLVEQLRDITRMHRFDYIVIEASGICEPAPIAQTICSIPTLGPEYIKDGYVQLDCIVTVVDALRMRDEFKNGNDLLRKHIDEEDIENLVIQQIEFCNMILLNKASEVSKEELAEVINRKFKVGIKFVGSKDSPYGYMVIDHKAGIVFKGSEIAQLRNLLNFETAEDRFNRFDQFVSRMLDENKGLTTKELNKMLRRQFSQTISRSGHIAWNMQEHQLPESIMTILKENDRVAWLQSFHPSNEIERAILCKLGTGCNQEDLHLEAPELKNTEHTVEHLKSIINSEFEESLAQRMFRDGLLAYHVGDKYYCLDVRHKTILCMDDFGIDTSKFKSNTKSEVQDKPVVRKPLENMNVGATAHQAVNGLSRVLNQNAGSHNGNREWEVGKHNNYDDIDDERGLKR